MHRSCSITLVLALAVAVPAAAAPPSHLWSLRFGDTSSQTALAVATDPSGNVVLAGGFAGSIDFGLGPLAGAGAEDVFIAGFSAAGTPLWNIRAGDELGPQRGVDVAMDGGGNIALAGYFSGTIDLGGGPLTSAGSNDAYLAHFGPGGVHRWSRRFGDADGQYAKAVAVDGYGNVFVTGHFSGSMDLGGGVLTASGFDDVFLAKFDATGAHKWSARFGGSSVQQALDVAVDHAGNVIAVGQFAGSIDFGGGTLASAGNFDVFVAKFTPNGTHLWSRRFGLTQGQAALAVAVDATGGLCLAGAFNNGVDLGGGLLTSAGAEDVFVARLDAAGNHAWSRRFGDASTQVAQALTVQPDGSLVVAGHFRGSVDFGTGPLTSAGLEDAFLAAMGPDGTTWWSVRYGDGGAQFVEEIHGDGFGGLLVAGSVTGSIDFGGGALASAGAEDAFLAKVGTFTPVDAGPIPPAGAAFLVAAPNPFNPSTALRFSLPRAGHARLTVHDARGALVATIADLPLSAGAHEFYWDGRSRDGGAAASGVYFARLVSPGATVTARLVLVK